MSDAYDTERARDDRDRASADHQRAVVDTGQASVDRMGVMEVEDEALGELRADMRALGRISRSMATFAMLLAVVGIVMGVFLWLDNRNARFERAKTVNDTFAITCGQNNAQNRDLAVLVRASLKTMPPGELRAAFVATLPRLDHDTCADLPALYRPAKPGEPPPRVQRPPSAAPTPAVSVRGGI